MALRIPKQQRPFPWVVVTIGVGLLVLAGTVSWYGYRWYAYGDPLPIDLPALASPSLPQPDESDISAMQIHTHTVAAHEPRYLTVPSLRITEARIMSAVADSAGFLQAPMNIHDVSWYVKSATPGAGGVTLLGGHKSGPTKEGVFAALGSIQPGAVIEVERGDNELFRYEVRDVTRLSLEDMEMSGTARLIHSAEPGSEALNMITRDGVWVPRYEQYSHRILVRATRVD